MENHNDIIEQIQEMPFDFHRNHTTKELEGLLGLQLMSSFRLTPDLERFQGMYERETRKDLVNLLYGDIREDLRKVHDHLQKLGDLYYSVEDSLRIINKLLGELEV